VNDDDVVEGIVLLRKGAEADATLDALHDEIKQLNDHQLPAGVKLVPHLDRSDLVHYTTHTVLRNLIDGVLLVTLILFLFLGNARSALIVTITIPFALLFAAILLDLSHIPANLLSLGALDFGMVVDGSVVMIDNIIRHAENDHDKKTFSRSPAAHEWRPVPRASSSLFLMPINPSAK
jgi:cobalt-zinc-cadmium resistance protein CzcA